MHRTLYILLSILVLTLPCHSNLAEFRIVGGSPVTTTYQFPYLVSLRRKNRHSCGGCIIAPTKIVTAAHCIAYRNKRTFTVIAGVQHLKASIDRRQQFNVIHYNMHPGFNKTTLVNDIVVLTLDKPIVFDETKKQIPLRSTSVEPGENLIVSGWGRTAKDRPISSTILWLSVKALKLSKCMQSIGSHFIIGQSNICSVPTFGEGTCKGDSGGPLVDDEKRLVGIVSWGKPCAQGEPDVYTYIPHYYNWILDQL